MRVDPRMGLSLSANAVKPAPSGVSGSRKQWKTSEIPQQFSKNTLFPASLACKQIFKEHSNIPKKGDFVKSGCFFGKPQKINEMSARGFPHKYECGPHERRISYALSRRPQVGSPGTFCFRAM
jgi:hypothetical protein